MMHSGKITPQALLASNAAVLVLKILAFCMTILYLTQKLAKNDYILAV